MNEYRLPLRLGLLAALVGALAGLSGCSNEPAVNQPPPPKVTVTHPEERELVNYDPFTGWLKASETVEVRSRVRGHLIKINFKDGDIVQAKKDVLFEIDPRPFDAALEAAEAEVKATNARLELATAQHLRTEVMLSKAAASRQDFDVTAGQKSVATADVAKARASVTEAKLNVEYCKIVAPISGRTSRAQLTVGNLINAAGSEPVLTTIVAIDPIYAYFNVDERSLQNYRRDRQKTNKSDTDQAPLREAKIPFEFGLDTDDGYPHKGVLDFAENQIKPGTGTIQVRGRIDNPSGKFIPGSRVKIRVPVSGKHKALVVPDEAILSDQGQRYLLVLDDKNVVYRRNVTLGRLLDDGMRVLLPPDKEGEGVNAADRVILRGQMRARLAYPVEPVQPPDRK